MSNQVKDLCDVLLDNIQNEFNTLLEQKFENAGGGIDMNELYLLKYDGVKDVISELPSDIQEEYNTLKNKVIEDYIWDGNLNDEDKNTPSNYEQYYPFHKKLEKTLRDYLSDKHNV
ncbi:MAG: hypothetical protein IJS88_07120 [Alphaproteobacteria bacterium]|nr:hypothetical protein [Alphaproteobacteria bacterium]